MSTSVKEFGKAWWSEVYNRIIGAAVFLDDASAECLHWDGGLFNLLLGGAVSVKTLSPFETSKKEHKKGVFITQATSTQLQTVCEIVRNSNFTHCILISCVSLDVVYLELNEGKDASDVVAAGRAPAEAQKQLEKMLQEAIGKTQSMIEVVHIPIFTISPTNVVFLTPPYQNLYPLYDGKLIPDSASMDLYTLSSNERAQVRRLASGLNSMFDSMNFKEDIYYMGAFSSLVAGVLENSPVCVTRRKNCSNPASLIIVDRTLDLCGVTSHSMESVLDKVMAILPRFPGHSAEVAVDMSALCQANVINPSEDLQLGPGCLFHANDDACIQTYENMINKSQKEVMVDLYNKLSKIDIQKSPSPKNLMKVTPQSLEKIVNASKGNHDVIAHHTGVLQQAAAMVHTLKSNRRSQIDLLMSLERQVQQSLAASRDSTSVLHQISQLIKTRKERQLSLDSLLALTVHVYSLSGTEVAFSKQHEDSLRETLSVAIFEDHKTLFPNDEGLVTPEECDDVARNIMARLKDVAQMRKILTKFNSVLKPCENGVGHEYRGVLQQLADSLVDASRPALPDLRHRHDGLKDLLRSGLNILTSKKPRSTKHPLDNQTVIIFVIGGITAEECKRLHRSIITSGIDNTVMIASTRFVTPVEAMRDVAFSKQHEDSLRETLSVAIFEDHKTLFPNDEGLVTPEECDDVARNIMARLKDVAQMRKILTKFNSVLKPCENGVGHEYRGVLQQLADSLVDASRPALPDLRHRHDGLKDLLRSGLNILTSKKPRSTKHPLDNQTVIIFVIGGITAEECKRLHRSIITSGIDNTVMIASTRFVTPVEAMRDVLAL